MVLSGIQIYISIFKLFSFSNENISKIAFFLFFATLVLGQSETNFKTLIRSDRTKASMVNSGGESVVRTAGGPQINIDNDVKKARGFMKNSEGQRVDVVKNGSNIFMKPGNQVTRNTVPQSATQKDKNQPKQPSTNNANSKKISAN